MRNAMKASDRLTGVSSAGAKWRKAENFRWAVPENLLREDALRNVYSGAKRQIENALQPQLRMAIPRFGLACTGRVPASYFWLSVCVLACFALPAAHGQQRIASTKLTELSLEQLMEIEVTSVSKQAEKLVSAPAAVFALTTDDLRRSGSPSLAESLRLVPGMQVARVGAHDWAISARGFADVFSNKLLVLRDGRSLYTPLFSGVFWDVQDTMLEDIERIEVVRGPGATLWGANAVNGVISILSKPARDTQGLLVSAAAGSDPELRGAVRFGGAVDAATHYRIYAKYTRNAPSELAGTGGKARDSAELGVAGFRFDRQFGTDGTLTLQGDAYSGRHEQVFIVPVRTLPFVASLAGDIDVAGGNVLGRWTSRQAGGGELMAQAYFDYTNRETPVFDDTRRAFDFEVQRRFPVAGRHELTVGAGFRATDDDVKNTEFIALEPPERQMNLWSAFVQDNISIAPRRWNLVLGTKLEHNDFTGVEIQPGARLLWTPGDHHAGWASIARAVRTPSRADDDVRLRQITSFPGVSIDVRGNRNLVSEELVAYEAGYRFRPTEKTSVDLALFYNDYSKLRTTEIDPASIPLVARLPPPPPPFVVFTQAGNKMFGETYGGELAVNAQVVPGWRVRTTYALLRAHFRFQAGSINFGSADASNRSPRHQATFWSQHDFGKAWQLDWRLRYVDRLPQIRVPRVIELDARIAWRPAERWEVALVGQNLFSPHHPEFVPSSVITPATEVPRRAFLEIRHGY
jgi:iron complex outermembrane receptor protein